MHAVGGAFGVFDFVQSLKAHPGEPEFEWFGFGRRERLDVPKQLLGIRYIGQALHAIGGGHFQSVTVCNGLISLSEQPFFHDSPIDLWIWASGQRGDGEMPFPLVLIPCAPDLLFFEHDRAHERMGPELSAEARSSAG